MSGRQQGKLALMLEYQRVIHLPYLVMSMEDMTALSNLKVWFKIENRNIAARIIYRHSD